MHGATLWIGTLQDDVFVTDGGGEDVEDDGELVTPDAAVAVAWYTLKRRWSGRTADSLYIPSEQSAAVTRWLLGAVSGVTVHRGQLRVPKVEYERPALLFSERMAAAESDRVAYASARAAVAAAARAAPTGGGAGSTDPTGAGDASARVAAASAAARSSRRLQRHSGLAAALAALSDSHSDDDL